MNATRPDTTVKPRRPRILTGISVIHLLALIGVYLAAELVAERHWLTTGLAYLPPLIPLALLPFLLLFSLLLRNRSALRLNLLALLLALPFLGLQLHLPPLSFTATPPLRVLTWNIELGTKGPEKIAARIRESGAEVVLLQEVTSGRGVPDPLPQLLLKLPGWQWRRAGEVAILTRLPIRGEDTFPLFYHGRQGQILEVEWQGRPLTLAAVHLSTAANPDSLLKTLRRKGSVRHYLKRSGEARARQVEIVLKETAKVQGPLLLGGDFNTPPRGLHYRRIASRFTDAFAARGNGFGWTYSNRYPLLRIDYLWSSEELTPVRVTVPSWPESDHRALLAEFQWK